MATKTKRPLKRGDKCWVRLWDGSLRVGVFLGQSELSELLGPRIKQYHVAVDGRALTTMRKRPVLAGNCRLVAGLNHS